VSRPGLDEGPIEGHRTPAALALLASASTLLCCALPALLVSIGAGSALVALTGAVPQLVWLSERKDALFAVSAVLLLAGGAAQWRARSLPCPIDPGLARTCTRARRTSAFTWAASVVIWILGATFAYVLPALG
jgi:hypothetical protein